MLCLLIRLLFVASAIAKNDNVNNRKQPPALKSGKSSFVSRVTRSTISTRNNDNNSKGKTARVTLALSQNERVVLNLEPDMELLSSDYEEVEITASGQRNVLKKLKDMDVCWFKGKIEGDPNSRVAVTDCGGNFEGLIKRGNGKHFIAKAVGDEGDVAVYASEDEEPAVGTCGAVLPSSPSRRLLLHEHSLPPAFSGLVDGLSHHHEGEHVHDDGDDGEPTLKQYFGESPPSSAAKRNLLVYSANADVMEIATASDFKYLNANGGAAAVALRNIQVLSIVRTMYENADFTRATSLRLKAQYFFSAADPYTVTADSQGRVTALKLLEAFTAWTKNTLSALPFDNIHLLTSHTFDSTTVGLAYIGTACNPSYKTGLTTASYGITSTANIMAHELGHNLGMDHDGDSTAAECASTGSMMGPYMNTCPLTGICPISPCSLTAKNKYTATVSCLQTWTEATCTDGLLNGDESGIDCGGSSCVACPGQGPLSATSRPTTRLPTTRPTKRPTNAPTVRSTRLPTFRPTRKPTFQPTTRPTRIPSSQPTRRPTRLPTTRPTRKPTFQPTTR